MRMSPVYNYTCNCHWYHYRKIKYGLKGSKRKSIESWLTLYQRGKSSLDPTSKLKEVLHLALPAVNFGGSSPHNQQESEIQYLSATSKMTAVLGLFPRQAIQHHSNSSLCPYHHHWLDGRGSGWTPGVGDGQGGLACCDSWGREESDTTETELNWARYDLNSLWICSRGNE